VTRRSAPGGCTGGGRGGGGGGGGGLGGVFDTWWVGRGNLAGLDALREFLDGFWDVALTSYKRHAEEESQ
jgi:hypothetical protein